MPLLSPQIQKALRASGLLENSQEEKTSLNELLESNNLSLNDLLSTLSDFAQNASAEALRLRAIETGLKMHGALKEQPAQAGNVTFIIQDTFSSEAAPEINPILIPRPKVVSIQ